MIFRSLTNAGKRYIPDTTMQSFTSLLPTMSIKLTRSRCFTSNVPRRCSKQYEQRFVWFSICRSKLRILSSAGKWIPPISSVLEDFKTVGGWTAPKRFGSTTLLVTFTYEQNSRWFSWCPRSCKPKNFDGSSFAQHFFISLSSVLTELVPKLLSLSRKCRIVGSVSWQKRW